MKLDHRTETQWRSVETLLRIPLENLGSGDPYSGDDYGHAMGVLFGIADAMYIRGAWDRIPFAWEHHPGLSVRMEDEPTVRSENPYAAVILDYIDTWEAATWEILVKVGNEYLAERDKLIDAGKDY